MKTPLKFNIAVLLAILFMFNYKAACEGEQRIRATWVPTGYGDGTEEELAANIKHLSSLGINRIYPSVWNKGVVYFNSPTFQTFTREKTYKDNLKLYVKYAKQYNMQVIAWFEFGLMSEFTGQNSTFGLLVKKLNWYIGEADGFSWMDPKKATNFVARIMVDALENYDIDGVQLDDHFAFPRELSGASEYIMTEAAEELSEYIRSKSKKILSLSPSPLAYALTEGSVNWEIWIRRGYFDEVVPQLYYMNGEGVKNEIAVLKQRLSKEELKKVIVGIAINHSGPPASWEAVQGILSTAEDDGFGISIWYHFGIVKLYPQQLAEFWKMKQFQHTPPYIAQFTSINLVWKRCQTFRENAQKTVLLRELPSPAFVEIIDTILCTQNFVECYANYMFGTRLSLIHI
eukprot:TRINITY_DN9330_c0_g1_i1.p1 TRINITY_DN9330_c0_g1~~TRINITY_DN9330_c0_g1_i1.p1  ORF type:complete len:401 (-),score=31.63 TRINITY_DN9330_c0_g1_i1:62-1264(-)